jgi:hypothetical protein
MVPASAAAITSSVLLLVSELLPFMPTKVQGILQGLCLFVRDALNSVSIQSAVPTGHTSHADEVQPNVNNV